MKTFKFNKNLIIKSSVWFILILILGYEVFFCLNLYKKLYSGLDNGSAKHVELINDPILQSAIDRYNSGKNYTPSPEKISDPFDNPVNINN